MESLAVDKGDVSAGLHMLLEDWVEVDGSDDVTVGHYHILCIGVLNEAPDVIEGIQSALVDTACLAVRGKEVKTAFFSGQIPVTTRTEMVKE